MAFGVFSAKKTEINRVVSIPVGEIVPNPHQPRAFFSERELRELAASIRQSGLLQPIIVRRLAGGRYELVAGERRLRAFIGLEEKEIPAIVQEYTDEQSAVLALIENLQRRDLHYLEEAYGIVRLMQLQGLNQTQISAKLGKSQPTIANKLRILRFSEEVQRRLLETGLTERHARALLKLEDEQQQLGAIGKIAQGNMTVLQAEKYIEGLLCKEAPPKGSRTFIIKDVRLFVNTIDKALAIMRQAGVPAQMKKSERDGWLEFTIRVPGDSAYRKTLPAEKESPRLKILPSTGNG